MLSSVMGFAGSKAAIFFVAGALSVSAIGVAAASHGPDGGQGNQGNGHGKAHATATATATETATPTVITTTGQGVEVRSEHGLTGRCNAITRGSAEGIAKKSLAPAFQDLDCDGVEN